MTPFGFLAKRQPQICRPRAAVAPRVVSPFWAAAALAAAERARSATKAD